MKNVEKKNDILRLSIFSDSVARTVKIGASIAVQGVCLTVTRVQDTVFFAEVIPETIRRSNFGAIRTGDRVNLEQAMSANGRFEGHMVQGHVDTTAELVEKKSVGESFELMFELPESTPYIVEKGSVAVNGISLTVISAAQNLFSVGIIPHTWENTSLSDLNIADSVNVEFDVVGKYIARLLSK